MGIESTAAVDSRIAAARRQGANDDALRRALVQAWISAADSFVTDGIVSAAEERALRAFKTHYRLQGTELDISGAYSRALMGAALRDLQAGQVPTQGRWPNPPPFNLVGGEDMVWFFDRVEYYEEKVRRGFVGGSTGVSVPIVKGVRWRVGGFKGERTERQVREHADSGALGLSTLHLYFRGQHSGFRIPLNRIVSFEPFSNGVSLCQDKSNARNQVFITNDGGFLARAVPLLSSRTP